LIFLDLLEQVIGTLQKNWGSFPFRHFSDSFPTISIYFVYTLFIFKVISTEILEIFETGPSPEEKQDETCTFPLKERIQYKAEMARIMVERVNPNTPAKPANAGIGRR
jgi:hypothetical protein